MKLQFSKSESIDLISFQLKERIIFILPSFLKILIKEEICRLAINFLKAKYKGSRMSGDFPEDIRSNYKGPVMKQQSADWRLDRQQRCAPGPPASPPA